MSIIVVKCVMCPTKFETVSWDRSLTCSDVCYKALRSKTAKRQHSEAVERLAAGLPVLGMHGKTATLAHKKRISAARRRNWATSEYRKNWRAARDKNKEKSSRVYVAVWKRPEIQKARRGHFKNTSLEIIVARCLDGLGVAFEMQASVGTSCIPDFFIPKENRIIECDGRYWHSSKMARRKDARNTRRYQRLGYKVSRWSERTINNASTLVGLAKRVLCP